MKQERSDDLLALVIDVLIQHGVWPSLDRATQKRVRRDLRRLLMEWLSENPAPFARGRPHRPR